MIGEPVEDVELLMGGIVIDDGMDDFSSRQSAIGNVNETN